MSLFSVICIASHYNAVLDRFRWRLISQLIKDISRVLQKLVRCFNGTII